MEIFGVGPLEFLLILVLALVILGPQDMVGTARKIGGWINRAIRSPTWRAIISTTQDIRELPQKIVREAGIEDAVNEIKDTATQVKGELNATTSEISSEMAAATTAVSSEMGVAVGTVNKDAFQTNTPPVTYPGGYPVWSPNTFTQHNDPEPPSVAEIIRTSNDPYRYQLNYFAEALQIGSKPGVDLEHVVRTNATKLPLPPPLSAPELLASALASFAGLSYSRSESAAYETGPAMAYPPISEPLAPAAYEITPADITVSPEGSETPVGEEVLKVGENSAENEQNTPDWAKGVPSGLSESDGITRALDERMRQMEEDLARIEARSHMEENPGSHDFSV
jgi:Sec-independent protein translocase protein TatA